MVFKFSNENIIIFSLIIILIAIYFLVTTFSKHNNILEKFDTKNLYNNIKFRDCQVYFTNEKKECDKMYAMDNNNICKYKFKNWKEIDSTSDSEGNIYKYPDKVIIAKKLNEKDFVNPKQDTRCFHELSYNDYLSIGPEGNTQVIDNKYYTYIDHVPFNPNTNICSIKMPLAKNLSGKEFYKIDLLSSKYNNIININKCKLNEAQNSFNIYNDFKFNDLIEKYGVGLEYHNNNYLIAFQVTKFPLINIKIYKFRYNYLCYQTQITDYKIFDSKLNMNYLFAVYNSAILIPFGSVERKIIENISGIDWNKYRNTSNYKSDMRPKMLQDLKKRKQELIDQQTRKNNKNELILDKIKANIIDSNVKSEYKINNFMSNDIFMKTLFLNQFNVSNYNRKYIFKSKDTIIKNNVENALNVKIKNTFKVGLKYLKVDHNYHNGVFGRNEEEQIEHIKNKLYIKELHQDNMRYGVDNFNGLTKMINHPISKGGDKYEHYSMWFSGYFYAHESGTYIFGTISDDNSHLYVNDEMIVNNGGPHGMRGRESPKNKYLYFNSGDISKIDIYFGEYGGGDNLIIYWRKNGSGNNRTAYWKNKCWFYHVDPNGRKDSADGIPTLAGDEDYIDGREYNSSSRVVSDSTGEFYYEFKNHEFEYHIDVKKDALVDMLVVGGGGGGGMDMGGGGGAGGFIEDSKVELSKDDIININVGDGGNGAPEGGNVAQGFDHQFQINGKNGQSSVVRINNKKKYEALGGGYGGSSVFTHILKGKGGDGASGGGASGFFSKPNNILPGKSIDKEQGNDGMKQYGVYTSGGGGGARDKAYNINGGMGKSSYITGSEIYFAGGGGGGGYRTSGGNGGIGGGGGGSAGVTNGGEGYNNGKAGGGGGINIHTNTWGGRAGDNTGGGGGGGGHKNKHNRGGRGGSGIVIIRVKKTPNVILDNSEYYLPSLSLIYNGSKNLKDVDNSVITFSKRFIKNPESLFYTSYIFLKTGYYKFNFNIDTSKYQYLYLNRKINIYNSNDKNKYITAYNENKTTKDWIYISESKFYIIDLFINYISYKTYYADFNIKVKYTTQEKNNELNFDTRPLKENQYEEIPMNDLENYSDLTYHIYHHYLNDLGDVNNNFNNILTFMGYYFNTKSFRYIIDYFKTLRFFNIKIVENKDVANITRIIDYISGLKLSDILTKKNDPNLRLHMPVEHILDNISNDTIMDYITYEQVNPDYKNEIETNNKKFTLEKYADRSLYIEVF